MTILKELPPTAEEYFQFYHNRAFTELIDAGDLELILKELRQAYIKYPDRKNRIEAMASVLKKGLNAPLPKKLKNDSDIKWISTAKNILS